MSAVATDLQQGGRGRRRSPVRVGAEGHPAGTCATRSPRASSARDIRPRSARAGNDRPQCRGRGGQETTSSARTPASPCTTCRVGEHFPLHPARIYDALKAGTERATVRASAALERRPHDHAPERGAEHRAPHCRSSTGSSSPTGTDWDVKCVPKGSGSEGVELPEDVRPRRRRERDQAVRARVDRRRGWQALPAGDRGRRHRRLGGLRDVSGQGGDRAAGRDEEFRIPIVARIEAELLRPS